MIRRCEVCGATRPRAWAEVDGFALYRCRHCGHLFVDPRPDEGALLGDYAAGRYAHPVGDKATRLRTQARRRATTLRAMAKERGLGQRLLDVGAATGIFLDEASDAGFSVEGVELAAAPAEEARGRGHRVVLGALEHLGPDDLRDIGNFDVVTAWEMIEHVFDPTRVFAAFARLVRPGGLLALSTPLGDGLPARLLGPRFPMVSPPEHLRLFSRRSLVALANAHGFLATRLTSFTVSEPASLARGLSRFALARLPAAVERPLARAGATVLWPLMGLVDRAGFGGEIEALLTRAGGGHR